MTPSSESPLAPRERLERAWTFTKRALSHWRTAVVVLLVGEVACALYLALVPPHYRSQTVLLWGERIRTVETGEPAPLPKNLAQRMRDIATSRQELQQIVEEFDLYRDIRRNYGLSDAVDELRLHIEFHAPGGDTFTIAFEGDSPVQAQLVTARIAERVIARDAELRRSQATEARDFLAGEKKHAQSKLDDAETELAAFMAEHPRFALDTTPLATGAAIRAAVGSQAGLDKPPAPRTRRVAVAGSKSDAPESRPAPAPRPPTAAELETQRQLDAEVARASAAVAAAREDLTEKRSRYTDAHPDVRASRDALARAQARLAVSERSASAALAKIAPAPATSDKPKAKPEPRYVEVPVRDPRQQSASAPTTDDLVALETEWSRLTRAVTEARQRHDQVETALFKADIASSSASTDPRGQVTVIDPAYLPPRPLPPGRRTIAALFFLAAAVAGVAAALARAFFDDRIWDRRDAMDVVDVLVQVPRRRRRAHV